MDEQRIEPSARVVRDSLHPAGLSRVTTMEVTLHRFVLAEFNTHRSFSRNSASSRAIPTGKQIARTNDAPALPVSFPREQPGMQGGEDLDGEALAAARTVWLAARDEAVLAARRLRELGVHKSVVSRLLEPFLWQTVLVTATEWANFFASRCSPLAQPELRAAADAMRAALAASEPRRLAYGEWHLPYVDGYEYDMETIDSTFYTSDRAAAGPLEIALRCAVARCARVSSLAHGAGQPDVRLDLKLYERLAHPDAGPMHASPFEHVCLPAHPGEQPLGNLTGWTQLRHIVEERERHGE